MTQTHTQTQTDDEDSVENVETVENEEIVDDEDGGEDGDEDESRRLSRNDLDSIQETLNVPDKWLSAASDEEIRDYCEECCDYQVLGLDPRDVDAAADALIRNREELVAESEAAEADDEDDDE